MNALNGCPYIRFSSWLFFPVHLVFCVQEVIEFVWLFNTSANKMHRLTNRSFHFDGHGNTYHRW